jgi:hypothetical protein
MRPTTGTQFIPQVICEQGIPWWEEVGGGKLLILLSDLSGNSYWQDCLAAKQEEPGEEN